MARRPLPNITSETSVPLFYQGGEQRDRFAAVAAHCSLTELGPGLAAPQYPEVALLACRNHILDRNCPCLRSKESRNREKLSFTIYSVLYCSEFERGFL